MAVIMRNGHSAEELVDKFVDVLNNNEVKIFLKYIQNIPIGSV